MCKFERYVGLLFLIAVLVPAEVAAATYYVSPIGDDGRSCSQAQTISTPKRTIDAGIGCLNPGDTLFVRDGVYREAQTCGNTNAVVCVDRGGSAGNPVVIRAENPWGAVIDGNNTMEYGFLTSGSTSYVRIEGFEITRARSDGIILNGTGSSNFEIIGNHIHHIARVCVSDLWGNSGVFSSRNNVTIARNVIHDNGRLANGELGCTETIVNLDHGVYVREGSNILIANNIFYNHARGWDIHLYSKPISNLRIVNNTFVFAGPHSGHVIVASDLAGAEISNNISYSPNSAFLYTFGARAHSNVRVRNNLVHGASLWTSTPSGVTNTGNLAGDPAFVSATSYDLRLQATSPAIDAGLKLTEVSTDAEGKPRDAYVDIGAYEFGATGSSPASPLGLRIVK